jgi:hypothetical protein
MKNISVIVFLLVFLLFTKFIYSNEIDIRKDLTLLKKNDQDFFLRNCEKSKVILDGSECLNFLGIKLFLVGYHNQSISNSELEGIYKKAINYLEIAGKKGSKQALKNLGWIFSNKELSFFDLEKSSLYFANSNKTEITKKKQLDSNIEKKNAKRTTNYSDIILAITLIKKIEIYFETTKSKKNKYVTNEQYKNAKKSFKRILDNKQINKTKLAELEKKVIESSNLIFTFLKEDIKIFNKENFNKANQTLEKLNFLLTN